MRLLKTTASFALLASDLLMMLLVLPEPNATVLKTTNGCNPKWKETVVLPHLGLYFV